MSKLKSKTFAEGKFIVTQLRKGKVIDTWESKNLVVDEGLNYYQGAALNGDAAKTTWYLALFSNNRAPSPGDTGTTVSSASGEVTTQYVETHRPTWVPDAIASGVISNNSTPAVFTIDTDVSLYGAFLVSENTKGGSVVGTILMGEALFGSNRDAIVGDVINVTYQITLSSV